jgi:DNA-binding winged helix-turn-helix (wHTH) protein
MLQWIDQINQIAKGKFTFRHRLAARAGHIAVHSRVRPVTLTVTGAGKVGQGSGVDHACKNANSAPRKILIYQVLRSLGALGRLGKFCHAPVMPTLALYSTNPARHGALTELLAEWPELRLVPCTSLAELLRSKADAALIDADAPQNGLEQIAHLQILPLASAPTHIARPLRWQALAPRLQLLLQQQNDSGAFAVGPLSCLPLERLIVTADGDELARLTDKEVQLLRLLSQTAGAVSRAELLEKVWGYRDDLDTHTVETHIYRLRQKIERDPAEPVLLLTTEGGYKLAEG